MGVEMIDAETAKEEGEQHRDAFLAIALVC
jgi:hypothetical protein